MKKSKFIRLVLVAGLFAGCQSAQEKGRKVYMRTDSTGTYTKSHIPRHSYFFFYPYTTYNAVNKLYEHKGYHNNRLARTSSYFFMHRRTSNFMFSSNYGSNKYYGNNSSRGGFGGGGYSGG
jgi:hypothetical protein